MNTGTQPETTHRAHRPANRRDLPAHQHGFALILSLSLMSFLLLLSISLATMVRLETASTNVDLQQKRARENAYFGLMVAVGQLQHTLGQDQRATASADAIIDAGAGAGKWTGAWDTTTPGAGPTWLASGDNPTPGDIPTGDDAITLVGTGTLGDNASEDDFIVAQRVDTSAAGGYAWYISDESLKMSVRSEWSAQDQWNAYAGNLDDSLKPDSIRDAMSTRVPSRNTLKEVLDGYDPDGADAYRLQYVTSLSQLSYLGNDSTGLFHHATLKSIGLLTNPVDGGFKINLTDNTAADTYGFINNALDAYLTAERGDNAGTYDNPYRGDALFSLGLEDTTDPSTDAPYEPDPVLVITPPTYNGNATTLFPNMNDAGSAYPYVAPILTEFALKLGITNVSEDDVESISIDDDSTDTTYDTNGDGDDYIHGEFVYELWNPTLLLWKWCGRTSPVTATAPCSPPA